MKEPRAYHVDGRTSLPFTEAPDEALRAAISAPVSCFVQERPVPYDEIAIDKAIAAGVLRQRSRT